MPDLSLFNTAGAWHFLNSTLAGVRGLSLIFMMVLNYPKKVISRFMELGRGDWLGPKSSSLVFDCQTFTILTHRFYNILSPNIVQNNFTLILIWNTTAPTHPMVVMVSMLKRKEPVKVATLSTQSTWSAALSEARSPCASATRNQMQANNSHEM